jgi:Dna[CI] antecedent, DciA
MRPLRQILSTEATLAGLFDRRQRELLILQRVQDNLPPALAAQVAIADGHPPELALAVGSGAAAGLLRQRTPVLLEILQRAGWEFTGIQVLVQARSRWAPLSKSIAKQLDTASALTLRAGADNLADAQLAAALRRLADQAREPASTAVEEPLDGVKKQHPK